MTYTRIHAYIHISFANRCYTLHKNAARMNPYGIFTTIANTYLNIMSSYVCVLVEVTGLEPTASASRTQRSTKLSHTSKYHCNIISHPRTIVKQFPYLIP